jgi:hypothetical protein
VFSNQNFCRRLVSRVGSELSFLLQSPLARTLVCSVSRRKRALLRSLGVVFQTNAPKVNIPSAIKNNQGNHLGVITTAQEFNAYHKQLICWFESNKIIETLGLQVTVPGNDSVSWEAIQNLVCVNDPRLLFVVIVWERAGLLDDLEIHLWADIISKVDYVRNISLYLGESVISDAALDSLAHAIAGNSSLREFHIRFDAQQDQIQRMLDIVHSSATLGVFYVNTHRPSNPCEIQLKEFNTLRAHARRILGE